jgi:N-acetylneuraminate synthase
MSVVNIGGIPVGDGHPCFVVAEIGINANGSVKIAEQLIDAAVAAGCQAVKFQKRHVPTVYTAAELAAPRPVDWSFIEHALERMREEDVREPIFSESALARLMLDHANTTNGDLKLALEFGLKEFDTIDRYCRERSIMWFASAWDGLSAHFLNGFNVPCHKIASPCLTHRDLLIRVRDNGKPVILSTGGSTMEQIMRAADILQPAVILHCTSTYPSEPEEANLAVIDALRTAFPGTPIGYSGHEKGIGPSLVAAAMGACVIERHITLDRTMPGSDQLASLEPSELTELVRGIRNIESGNMHINELVSSNLNTVYYGSPEKRVLPSEVPIMTKLRRVTDF